MIRVCVEVDEVECCHEPQFRIIPTWGPVREQTTPLVKRPPSTVALKRFSEKDLLMDATMTATQQVDIPLVVKDKKGNPAKVDGVPVWATDNSDILAITPSADGMKVTVVAVGIIGEANVQVTCDADLGAGVSPLIGTSKFTITAGVATVIELTPGTPTEQP